MTEKPQIGPMKVSHVNLRVADMDRAIAFYCNTLGLTIARHRPGSSLAFLSSGSGLSFDLALDVRTSQDGLPASPQQTGLDHVAFLCPDRPSFLRAVKHIVAVGVKIDHVRDHGFTESVYFSDPDGNGLEVYWECPKDQWPMEADGQLGSRNKPLSIEDLFKK